MSITMTQTDLEELAWLTRMFLERLVAVDETGDEVHDLSLKWLALHAVWAEEPMDVGAYIDWKRSPRSLHSIQDELMKVFPEEFRTMVHIAALTDSLTEWLKEKEKRR